MTAAAAPTIWPWLPLGLAMLWLILACLKPRLPRRWHMRANWALVAAGVPVLGWMTLNWGPGLGVAAFGVGLLMLLARPTPRRGPSPLRTPEGQP